MSDEFRNGDAVTHPLESDRARELIEAAKAGDRDALGQLLAACRP